MKKETAVEWLIQQLTPSISLQKKHIDELEEQAKEMHKQEIIDAYNNGEDRSAELYYNETYGK
jgi:hypothetical protein